MLVASSSGASGVEMSVWSMQMSKSLVETHKS
jgi:hypothetical protein